MRRVSVIAILVPLIALGGFLAYAQETPPAPTPTPAPAPAPAPAAAAPTAPAATPALAAPAAPVVSSIKIVVDNKAKSDGEIRFDFTPAGGATKQTRVTVLKGMDKRDICRDIAKELTVLTGAEYKVDQYDPDKVKVEGKSDAKFSLTLAGQTVTGLSVTLK